MKSYFSRLKKIFLIRSIFVFLIAFTLMFAINSVVQQRKTLSQAYQKELEYKVDVLAEMFKHPSGQFALINRTLLSQTDDSSLRPFIVPYSVISVGDSSQAADTAEKSGCWITYVGVGRLCAAIGNDGSKGAYLYVVGEFSSEALILHKQGTPIDTGHHILIDVDMRGHASRWAATFEAQNGDLPSSASVTGYRVADNEKYFRDVKEYKGSIAYQNACSFSDGVQADDGIYANASSKSCTYKFTLRVPYDALRADAFLGRRWPPMDLSDARLRIRLQRPSSSKLSTSILDTNATKSERPFSLSAISGRLNAGERLFLTSAYGHRGGVSLTLLGENKPQKSDFFYQLLASVFSKFERPNAFHAEKAFASSLGSYKLKVFGNPNIFISDISDSVGYTLNFAISSILSICTAWLIMEFMIIRQIMALTNRADRIPEAMKKEYELGEIRFDDLRGHDEFGRLAGSLHDLIKKVDDDVRRERIRIEKDKDMWQAIGHEIVSPLQSLSAIHDKEDQSAPYVRRMQNAVRRFYGQASVVDALQTTSLDFSNVNLAELLSAVAQNAPTAGYMDVQYTGINQHVMVRIS